MSSCIVYGLGILESCFVLHHAIWTRSLLELLAGLAPSHCFAAKFAKKSQCFIIYQEIMSLAINFEWQVQRQANMTNVFLHRA